MLTIDGSEGEGGGQVLRSALALSAVTSTPFRITNIRAGRERGGLLRQHLTGLNAITAICDAEVDGARLGSTEVVFKPRAVVPGDYKFAVGTAGSANLVLQTVLLPLALAKAPSTLVLEGGTHNPTSPPFHYLEAVYAPLLAKMGLTLGLTLERWGFYPAGGGRFVAAITPVEHLTGFDLLERGDVRDVQIRAVVAGLPEKIGLREVAAADHLLGRDRGDGRVLSVAGGPGNAMWIKIVCEHATELFTAFGEKRVSSDQVAERCASEAKAWLAANVPVAEHTADQLLLPLALAGRGSFRTSAPTLHTRTHVDVIQRFLDVPIALVDEGPAWRITVG